MGRSLDQDDATSARKRRKLDNGQAVSEATTSAPEVADAPLSAPDFQQVTKPDFIENYHLELGSGAEVYYQEDVSW